MSDTEKQKVGKLGENIACLYLEKYDFKVIGRNYLKKWGEIDIIATKDDVYHFVEVKSVSCDDIYSIDKSEYQPEENIHMGKLKRLERAVETYLLDNRLSAVETDYQIDALAVFIDVDTKEARCRLTEKIGRNI